MKTHTARVVFDSGGDFLARCSCGWQSAYRRTCVADAERDAAEHDTAKEQHDALVAGVAAKSTPQGLATRLRLLAPMLDKDYPPPPDRETVNVLDVAAAMLQTLSDALDAERAAHAATAKQFVDLKALADAREVLHKHAPKQAQGVDGEHVEVNKPGHFTHRRRGTISHASLRTYDAPLYWVYYGERRESCMGPYELRDLIEAPPP